MLVVSDLDGTLIERNKSISLENRRAFEFVRQLGGLSAIATGRSLFGVETELEPDFPLDYLIFSSGSGIYDWKKKKLVHKTFLSAPEICKIFSFLKTEKLDFTIQLEAPGSHRFHHSPRNQKNLDFMARLSYHQEHSQLLKEESLPEKASEFIVVEDHSRGEMTLNKIQSIFGSEFNVVRATSPFDGKSVWIEVFHKDVSKGNAAEWLRTKHDLPKERTFALGNDTNDLQLLSWAQFPLVVRSAASELLKKYTLLDHPVDFSLSEALKKWGIRQ